MANTKLHWELTTSRNCEEIIAKYNDLKNMYRVVVVYNSKERKAEYFVRPIISHKGTMYSVGIVLKNATFTNVSSLDEILEQMANRIDNTTSRYRFICGGMISTLIKWPRYRLKFTTRLNCKSNNISIIIGDETQEANNEYTEIHVDTIKDGKVEAYYHPLEGTAKDITLKVVKL